MTSRRETHSRIGGFTLLEVVISLTITVLLLMVGVTSLGPTEQDSTTSTKTWTDADDKLVRLGRQMVEELKCASFLGEDLNGNRLLDAGEDGNGNGRLDSDWRITPNSITFNRVLADGLLTLPITYRLVGTDVERVVMTSTAGTRTRALVALGAQAFAVAQNGNSVVLTARFQDRTRDGKTIARQRSFDLSPRN